MDAMLYNIVSFSRHIDSIHIKTAQNETVHENTAQDETFQYIHNICQSTCETVVDSLNLEDNVIYLRGEDNRFLQVAAFGNKHCPESGVLSPLSLAEGEGVVGMAARQSSSLCISDTSQMAHYIIDDQPRLSELAVPIRYQGEVIGVIDSEHPEVNFFKKEHELFMEGVSAIIAPRIAHIISRFRANIKHNRVQQKTGPLSHQNKPKQTKGFSLDEQSFHQNLQFILKNYHRPEQWNLEFLQSCALLSSHPPSHLEKIKGMKQLIEGMTQQMMLHNKSWAHLLMRRYLQDRMPQNLLADQMNMAFSTFRRHQTLAKDHLISQLWLNEENLQQQIAIAS